MIKVSDPVLINTIVNYGNALKDEGQLDEAIVEYERAMSYNVPQHNYTAGLQLGIVCHMKYGGGHQKTISIRRTMFEKVRRSPRSEATTRSPTSPLTPLHKHTNTQIHKYTNTVPGKSYDNVQPSVEPASGSPASAKRGTKIDPS